MLHPVASHCHAGARRRPLDPPGAEIARLEVVAQSKSTGMTLRLQPRENRSKITVRADIHSESTGFGTRPELEVVRPETEIAPVASRSFGDIAAVSSRSQSVENESEVGIKPQSGYSLPARHWGQEPKITPIAFHPVANPRSFHNAHQHGQQKVMCREI